jgi:hypothetical protein
VSVENERELLLLLLHREKREMDGASLTNTLLKSHLYLFLIAVFSQVYFYIQKEREKPCQSWTV